MDHPTAGSPRSYRYNEFLGRLINSGISKLEAWKVELNRRRFDHRGDDTYIATYMKSGTTLLQMVVYQLVSNGDTGFDYIYDVSPSIDDAIMSGNSLRDFPSPRLLKTHGEYRFFPKNLRGKIIYSIRDGMDVAVSMYYHLKNYHDPGMEWDSYFDQVFLREDELWFSHVAEWLENKNRLNVHYVRYEELTGNMRNTVRGIADFLELSPSEQIMERVLKHCSFAYMKANQHKFGERPDHRVYDQFIRKGESNKGGGYFNEWQKEQYCKLYDQYLAKYNLGYNQQQVR